MDVYMYTVCIQHDMIIPPGDEWERVPGVPVSVEIYRILIIFL